MGSGKQDRGRRMNRSPNSLIREPKHCRRRSNQCHSAIKPNSLLLWGDAPYSHEVNEVTTGGRKATSGQEQGQVQVDNDDTHWQCYFKESETPPSRGYCCAEDMHLDSEEGELKCKGRGQPWEKPALVGEVCDDELLAKLWPHAGVSDGNGKGHLGAIYRSLSNKDASGRQSANLYITRSRGRFEFARPKKTEREAICALLRLQKAMRLVIILICPKYVHLGILEGH